MAEVVHEGQSLDEFLEAAEGACIAVPVDGLQIRGDGGEELGDVLEAGVDVLLDALREVLVQIPDPIP
jgi:hypothetical protein